MPRICYQYLSGLCQTVKQNKDECVHLLEQIHKLLVVIVILHIKSDTDGEMPPAVLHHLGKFTQYIRYPAED